MQVTCDFCSIYVIHREHCLNCACRFWHPVYAGSWLSGFITFSLGVCLGFTLACLQPESWTFPFRVFCSIAIATPFPSRLAGGCANTYKHLRFIFSFGRGRPWGKCQDHRIPELVTWQLLFCLSACKMLFGFRQYVAPTGEGLAE